MPTHVDERAVRKIITTPMPWEQPPPGAIAGMPLTARQNFLAVRREEPFLCRRRAMGDAAPIVVEFRFAGEASRVNRRFFSSQSSHIHHRRRQHGFLSFSTPDAVGDVAAGAPFKMRQLPVGAQYAFITSPRRSIERQAGFLANRAFYRPACRSAAVAVAC